MKSQVCPYCKKYFDKPPKRKTVCSYCSKSVYVRFGKLVTKDEMICIDEVKRMEYDDFLNLGQKNINNLNVLWAELQIGLDKFSELNDYDKMSSILLHMGIIAEREGNYKNCIKNYFLSTHFHSLVKIQQYKNFSSDITLNDFLNTTNFMEASPVIKSIEVLNLQGINSLILGKLALAPKLSVDEKLEVLNDVLAGDNRKLKGIDFENT